MRNILKTLEQIQQSSNSNWRSQQSSSNLREYGLSPSYGVVNPDNAQAELTRAQWRLMQERYHPIEDDILGFVGSDRQAETLADASSDTVRRNFAAQPAMTARTLGRRGVQQNAAQRQVAERLNNAGMTATAAEAENATRGQMRDLRAALAGDMSQIGAQLSGQATSGLGQAASMQQAREQSYDAAKSQHKQNMISTGVSLGAMALAFAGI